MTLEQYQADLAVLNLKMPPNLFRFRDLIGQSPNLVCSAWTNIGHRGYLELEMNPC